MRPSYRHQQHQQHQHAHAPTRVRVYVWLHNGGVWLYALLYIFWVFVFHLIASSLVLCLRMALHGAAMHCDLCDTMLSWLKAADKPLREWVGANANSCGAQTAGFTQQSTIHMGASDGSLSMRHYVRLEWARQTVRTTGFECVTTKLTVIVAAYTHSAYRNRRARDFCCCLFNNIWFVAKFFVCFFSVLLVMVGQSLAVVLFLFGFMIVLWYSFLALSSIYYLVCKWIVFIVGKRIRNFG